MPGTPTAPPRGGSRRVRRPCSATVVDILGCDARNLVDARQVADVLIPRV
ncbi:hypothetical protein [Micromonospora sp. NPDC023644]